MTGMLAQALPRDGDVRVQLLVMAPSSGPCPPTRYHQAACLPMIPDFSSSGRGRLRAMRDARKLARVLISKAHQRGERAVIFVRNHPALMLVASSLRHCADGYVFQSSHPLELLDKSRFKRVAYRAVLRAGGWNVDGILAVSPLGLERVRRLCARKSSGLVVPLLSDLSPDAMADESIWGGGADSVRFIYAGTHAARRRLDVVLEGAVSALDSGVDAVFAFLGGKPHEIDALRESPGVRRWESAERILFVESMPRPRIPGLLRGADVGLSLVPESLVNREMSPTKLAEYMGAGLAVLASRGVELQEVFVRQSSAGLLISFDSPSIAKGISRMADDRTNLERWKMNAQSFSSKELKYSNYVQSLRSILDGSAS